MAEPNEQPSENPFATQPLTPGESDVTELDRPAAAPAEGGILPEETAEQRTAREAEEKRQAEAKALTERTKAARDVAKNTLPDKSASSSPEQPKPTKEAPAVSPPQPKEPEGFWGRAGDSIRKGVDTFTDWMKKAWGWTEKGVGKGWEGFVSGVTAAVGGIAKGWNWFREKSAHTFGSLVGSIENQIPLPDWIKKPLNFIMGEYGVLYKNLAIQKIELASNDPRQELSLAEFKRQHVIYARKNSGATFDTFCAAVIAALVNDPLLADKVPLRVTQAQLEEVAVRVAKAPVVTTNTTAPAAAPVAAPGTAPATAAESATPLAFESIPAGTNLLEVIRKIRFENRDFEIRASKDGTIKIDSVTYTLKVKNPMWGANIVVPWIAPSIEKLEWQADGLLCTGSFGPFASSQKIARDVLAGFLRRHVSGERKFEDKNILLKQV